MNTLYYLFAALVAVAALLGCLSSNVFKQRASTGSDSFSLSICLDAAKFLWLCVFTMKRRFAQEFVQIHGRGVQKVHFRLTFVPQKHRCRRRRCCLSFLLFWSKHFVTMVTWHHFSLLYWVQVDSPAASTMLSRQHLNGQRTLILLSQSRHSFVTPHLRVTYPAHFHLIDAMSFISSAVKNFLVWPFLSQIYGQYLLLHCPLRRSQLVPYALRVFLILLLL